MFDLPDLKTNIFRSKKLKQKNEGEIDFDMDFEEDYDLVI